MKTTLKKLVGRFLVAFSCWGAISLCQQYAYAGETTQEKVLRDATVCIYRASDLIKYFDENGQPKEEFKYNLPPRYTGTIIGKQDNGEGVVVTALSTKLKEGVDLTDHSKAWWIVLQPVHNDQGETVKMVHAMGATFLCENESAGILVMSIPSGKFEDKRGRAYPTLPEKFPDFQMDDVKASDDKYFCLTYSGDRTDEDKVEMVSQMQASLGRLRELIVKSDGSVESKGGLFCNDKPVFSGSLFNYMTADRLPLTVRRTSQSRGQLKKINFSSESVDKNSLGAAVYSARTNNVVGLLEFATGADLQACTAESILSLLKDRSILSQEEITRITEGTKKGPQVETGIVDPPPPPPNLDKDTIIYGAIGLLGVVLIIVLVLLFRSKSTAGEGTTYEYDAPTVVMPRGEGGADKSTPVMRLVGEDGTSYGVTYDELKRGVSLGRGSVADKVFSNETVSRKHVIIFRKHGRAFVEDCGSSGGTILNGVKLEPNKPALITRKTSDLKLANYTVRVVIVMDQN